MGLAGAGAGTTTSRGPAEFINAPKNSPVWVVGDCRHCRRGAVCSVGERLSVSPAAGESRCELLWHDTFSAAAGAAGATVAGYVAADGGTSVRGLHGPRSAPVRG